MKETQQMRVFCGHKWRMKPHTDKFVDWLQKGFLTAGGHSANAKPQAF